VDNCITVMEIELELVLKNCPCIICSVKDGNCVVKDNDKIEISVLLRSSGCLANSDLSEANRVTIMHECKGIGGGFQQTD
jgi:hypothetical protein